MDQAAQTAQPLWPLAVYFGAVVANVGGMLLLSYLLGQRHQGRATGEPYESGILATGSAQVRFDIRFFRIALFFVIFDLEAVFLLAWAISVREVGWLGFVEAAVFVLILLAALVYLWRVGALEWGPQSRRQRRQRLQAGVTVQQVGKPQTGRSGSEIPLTTS